jgi:hypothetical protein
MKIHAMKNDPSRAFQEMPDLHFLLGLPGIDADEVRAAFARAGSWNATVRSSGSADRFRLDRDLPTTPDDVAALRRAGAPRRIELDVYLRFLRAVGPPPPEALRARRSPTEPPFDLTS